MSVYGDMLDEKNAEIEALRKHNRDLQQTYDHIVKLEQDRCREVVEARDQLAAVTSERDALQHLIAGLIGGSLGRARPEPTEGAPESSLRSL